MRDGPQTPLIVLAASLLLAVGLLLVLAVTGLGGGGTSASGGSGAADTEIDPVLLAELRDGGEVLLFRHALTDRSQTDADPQNRGTCAMQRNLSPEGIAQAARIGMAMRELGLTIDPVLTSPFCRAVDTALALLGQPTGPGADLGPVQPVEALRLTEAAPEGGMATPVHEESRRVIEGLLGGSGTAVVVGHMQTIAALHDLQVEEGDAVVLGRGPDGGAEIRGVIAADDW